MFAFDPKQKIAAEYLANKEREVVVVRNFDECLLEEIFKVRGSLE